MSMPKNTVIVSLQLPTSVETRDYLIGYLAEIPLSKPYAFILKQAIKTKANGDDTSASQIADGLCLAASEYLRADLPQMLAQAQALADDGDEMARMAIDFYQKTDLRYVRRLFDVHRNLRICI